MFTFDLEEAKSWITSEIQTIVMFVVLLDDGRKLPVYCVIDYSLMCVFENIYAIRHSVIDYCCSHNYKYSCLIGVSYVL